LKKNDSVSNERRRGLFLNFRKFCLICYFLAFQKQFFKLLIYFWHGKRPNLMKLNFFDLARFDAGERFTSNDMFFRKKST